MDTITQAYTEFDKKLGNEAVETLITFTAETVKNDVDVDRKDIATKLYLAEIKTELKIALVETKTNMIKWMFIFFVGQVAVMFGLLYFFKK